MFFPMPRDSRLTDGVCNGSEPDASGTGLGLVYILFKDIDLVENMSVYDGVLACLSGSRSTTVRANGAWIWIRAWRPLRVLWRVGRKAAMLEFILKMLRYGLGLWKGSFRFLYQLYGVLLGGGCYKMTRALVSNCTYLPLIWAE